jgi:hypothetical protein
MPHPEAFGGRREQTRWELTVAINGGGLHVLFEEENKVFHSPISFFWIGIAKRIR